MNSIARNGPQETHGGLVRSRPILDETDRIGEALDTLSGTLNELESRLTPIARMSEKPDSKSGLTLQANKNSTSELVARLHDLQYRIAAISDRVVAMTEVLDL